MAKPVRIGLQRPDVGEHVGPIEPATAATNTALPGAGFDTRIVRPSERGDPLYRRSGFQPLEVLLELAVDT
ncbi:hypothetical protein [Streptomyces sp. NPDC006971]|uniref:hypothetical protein n=1 Tax=Streptomyces sp. NPDC006971 TaxID=3154784 RepID=UPI0033FF726F